MKISGPKNVIFANLGVPSHGPHSILLRKLQAEAGWVFLWEATHSHRMSFQKSMRKKEL